MWPEFSHDPDAVDGSVVQMSVPSEPTDDTEEKYASVEQCDSEMVAPVDSDDEEYMYESGEDSDVERPEASFVGEPVKKRGMFDSNERGEEVGWGQHADPNPGNIITTRRSERRKKSRYDCGSDGKVAW